MNHNRVAMLAALNLVKPALATKDLIEELAHVWFDGGTVTAYNDADLGIQAPFQSPFKGGIRGSLLSGLLQNSRATEVIIEPTENEGEVFLKAARAKATLAVLDLERAVYELPPDSDVIFDFEEDFTAALKAVLISVGNDTSLPEKMGVTIMVGKQFLDMFASDGKSISHAQLKLDKKATAKLKMGSRYIVPTAFCEQLLRLCPNGGALDLQQDIVTARNEAGVFIWARLVEVSDKPFDFIKSMDRHMDFDDNAKFLIPGRLSLALDRAMTMLEGLPDEPILVTVANQKIRFETTAEGRGILKDSVDTGADIPDVTFKVSPALIKRALGQVTIMAMGTKAVWMTNDEGFTYLAATVGGA